MRVVRVILAASVLLSANFSSQAQTGYELFSHCQYVNSDFSTPQVAIDAFKCTAYLSGVWDGLALSHSGFCSGPVQLGQIVLVFVEWARRNPQYLSRPAGEAALASFASAFPCK
jgi:hypothetical protein